MITGKVRTAVAWGLLVVLILAGLYLAGALDYFAIERIRYLAQKQMEAQVGNRWYGVPIYQYPEDLMVYQEIIYDTRPDLIVETGTHYGGLTLYFATLLETLNPEGRIATVDIDTTKFKQSLEGLPGPVRDRLSARITVIEGSSIAPETVAQVRQLIPPSGRVLVLLDADHTSAFVLQEAQAYAPLVPVGGYLIVNDTHLHKYYGNNPQGGARQAVRDFLAANPNFTADTSREKFIITCSPSGFLKRMQ